jgi:HTH-type transcriptional regulator / antitoxin HigA
MISLAIPPGETIREILIDKNITPSEFAVRMGLPAEETEQLLNGINPVSYSTSELLEKTLGIPAQFWINLEAIYREALKKEKNNANRKL